MCRNQTCEILNGGREFACSVLLVSLLCRMDNKNTKVVVIVQNSGLILTISPEISYDNYASNYSNFFHHERLNSVMCIHVVTNC